MRVKGGASAGPAGLGGPLVSIVTPSLNQGGFIEEGLASVRAQTYPNVEHLVIDGGSTDETLPILREAPGIRWISEPDAGMYDAINKGLRMSSGDIVGYLNCDDVYTPWAIGTAVRVLSEHPEADAVFGDGLTIDESTMQQRLALIPPFDRRSLALSGSLVQPAVFWRRRVLDEIGGFDAALRFVGDLDYWLRLGRDRPLVRVDEVLAIERHHDSALSRMAADRMRLEAAGVRRRHAGSSRSATLRARTRGALWRRYLWARLLWALARGTRQGGPWREFIRSGELRVSVWRVAAMFVPILGGRFAWDAVRSGRQWFREAAHAATALEIEAIKASGE
jgi:glycosyltransferase involved in cell wall biosynthesis